MTALDEIKEFEKDATTSNRELIRALLKEELDEEVEDELETKLSEARDALLDAIGSTLALYRVTVIQTRQVESAEFAASLWNTTRRGFLAMFRQWSRKPLTTVSELEGLIEFYRNSLRDLAAKADQEYRSYAETAHLLSSPANARRLRAALARTREGHPQQLPVFESAEEAKKFLRRA
jgi:hypothetical protein